MHVAERHRMWLESRQSVSETRSTSLAQAGSICCPVVDDDNAECGAIVSDVIKFEGIIVNELLCYCYVYNRIDILTNDDLVNIVSHFYDESDINSALIILNDITTRLAPNSSRRRLPKRIGKDKKVKSVEDICTLMHDFSVAMVDAPSARLPHGLPYTIWQAVL